MVKGKRNQPDWSFQDAAVRRCRTALATDPNRRVALVVPTGGGKTRLALRIALEELRDANAELARVVWITHRKLLRKQAKKQLQRLMSEGTVTNVPDWERIDFIMVSRVAKYLETNKPILAIVDEAHHAAAPSYTALQSTVPLRALYLTATPNRGDEKPLGVDEVAYTVTFRELAEYGVVLIPAFEEFPVRDFTWSSDQLEELAGRVISRANNDFVKTLIITPTIEKVRDFYEALQKALTEQKGHVLNAEDIGFVDSKGNPDDIKSEDYIEKFSAKPRGILVSADMLLEGHDDPSINSVVVTYPSQSLIVLMQAAGRCVRYANGKRNAFVVQASNRELAYYFDHRWLYQEISDYLRPTLADVSYSSKTELVERVSKMLELHNVRTDARDSVLAGVSALVPGETCRLLLAGLPYTGPKDAFNTKSEWHPVLETAASSARFRQVFNGFCARGAMDSDPRLFLQYYLPDSTPANSEWRRYYTMLLSMHYASRELFGEGPAAGFDRPFTPNGATTWLKYVSFFYEPAVPSTLFEFLEPCFNRDELAAAFAQDPTAWCLALRAKLPLGPFIGFLLTCDQQEWLSRERARLTAELASVPPGDQWGYLDLWRSRLASVPLPIIVALHIEAVLEEERYAANSLSLEDPAPAGGISTQQSQPEEPQEEC